MIELLYLIMVILSDFQLLLNVIRLETVEHGSLDILSLMKQYGHGSENYRLMELIRLAQLSQGTYNTKENITKVEDEEDRTQKVLTNLKEAKDNAGEFLEIKGIIFIEPVARAI